MFQILVYLFKNCNPTSLKKITPSFQAALSKNWDPVKPAPLFENLATDSTLPPFPCKIFLYSPHVVSPQSGDSSGPSQ